jgi:hypothetical protein
MEFISFEEALKICLSAAEGSPEQEAALAHCLQTAPPDLRRLLTQRLGGAAEQDEHDHEHLGGCGCGCTPKPRQA